MSEPRILELLERVKALEEKIETKQNNEWKSQDVSLGMAQSITIEAIKNANEVQLYGTGANNVEMTLYFTRNEHGKWLHSSYVEWNTNTNHHMLATVYFDSGMVSNGSSGDTSITIKKISWR